MVTYFRFLKFVFETCFAYYIAYPMCQNVFRTASQALLRLRDFPEDCSVGDYSSSVLDDSLINDVKELEFDSRGGRINRR